MKKEHVLIEVADSGDRNVMKKKAENIITCKSFTIAIQSMWKEKNKCDNRNNTVKWNHLKFIQKIPEQHNRKAQN